MEPVVGEAVGKRKASPPSDGNVDGPDVKKTTNEEETASSELTLPGLPDDVLHKIIYRLDPIDRINVSRVCERLCEVEGRARQTANREDWDTLTVTKLAGTVKIRLSSDDSRDDRLWTEPYAASAAILSRVCQSVRVRSVVVKLDLSVSGQSKCLSVLPLIECTDEVAIYHQCKYRTSTVETLPASFLQSPFFFPGAKDLKMFRVFMGLAEHNLFYEQVKRSSFSHATLEVPSKGIGEYQRTFARMDAMGIVETDEERTTTRMNAQVFCKRNTWWTNRQPRYYEELQFVMVEGGWKTMIKHNEIVFDKYNGAPLLGLERIPYLAAPQ